MLNEKTVNGTKTFNKEKSLPIKVHNRNRIKLILLSLHFVMPSLRLHCESVPAPIEE